MSKTDNLKDYLEDLYQGIVSKKPGASKNPQDFRREIESIVGGSNIPEWDGSSTVEDENGEIVSTEGLAYRLGYGNGEYYYICDGLGTTSDTDIVIASEYDGKAVKELKSDAFANTNITSVVIADSLTSIADSAFYYCQTLARVTIGKGVKSIGVMSFSNCPLLTSITLPEGVTSIGMQAFMGCRGLKSIVIPKSVVSVASQAFSYCSNLTDVYYSGTEAEWNAITFGSDNTQLTNATIHYNSNN